MQNGTAPSFQLNSQLASSLDTLLSVRDLKMHFPITKGIFGGVKGYVKAVDEVSFDMGRGETLGLVGESGCGKTTAGRSIVRAYTPTSGEVMYYGGNPQPVDLAKVASKTNSARIDAMCA